MTPSTEFQLTALSSRLLALSEDCGYLSNEKHKTDIEIELRDLKRGVLTCADAIKRIKDKRGVERIKLPILEALMVNIVIDADKLETHIPGLFRDTVRELERMLEEALNGGNKKHGWYCSFCIFMKAAFEYMLLALVNHFKLSQVTESLHDRLVLLKEHITPVARLNAFFDLKEAVNRGSHGNDISLDTLEEIVFMFRKSMAEMIRILEEPPAAKKTLDRTKYKTTLCRNWTRNKSCPHGEKCSFAHGGDNLIPNALPQENNTNSVSQ
jgi:hypothetical protein